MPRRPRILVDGGYYHILSRGNDRRKLFRYRQDYRIFLKVIKAYLKKFKVALVNYCLMPNHIHLLIQAQEADDLPKFMQGVLQVYASYFRKRYHSTGFVFQNRYKSLFIDKDSYLMECARYIERNPLRAKITSNLSEYPFSSFLFYAKGKDNDIIITKNPLYLDLAQTDTERQERYKEYVLQERPYEHIVDQAFKVT
ncbi:MAG: transposase [Candidatus Omnitrophica bacterium]|nr:transposase [Candidatus Omnitrophota bacterium]